ncbi:protein-L-isoaspartate O-methyltransferase family protein [Paracraurococcus ruber]|uniref:Protein-L-isoaspartate O-methyltransferase n=1 Tax=Paracraurococcus ruber TaxID=77675 RepID=A0ABS1D7H9_9PROT|nr:protein-L-isoaspartate O-methyltransferase [Paracraurococcus ruber]MBK1662440.1 protein-L-isoaspartate(D-aspartate) O-methyltransferase [Paracraurococcus ruber]TDG26708.1 protein-L-isoaspartate O-methyltransferase [Paracraurococcus ruber]
MDFADARKRMVDGQLRPNRVTDPRLLDAMRDLPREEFLPRAVRARAYADEDVPLPGGRALIQPMAIARLVQLAAVRPGDRALVVCAGTGYGAAVLARCGARVTALESAEPLLAIAGTALAACLPAGAVRLEAAPPAAGFAAGAPYDAILIEGEVPEIPAAIAAQLAEGGRLVAVLGAGRRNGVATLARRLGGTVTTTPAFDCATVALPEFAAAPGFVF